jgi:uncharacterized protein (TIGR00297 family)
VSAAALATALITSGTLLLIAVLTDRTALELMAPGAVGRLVPAVLANAGAATVAWLEDAITPSGALAGFAVGVVIYLGAGWEGWLMLGATFITALAASGAGSARKRALGIAQEQEGRRGARHVVANCGAAAAAAVVAIASPHQSAAWLALVAALTAAGSDTVASEIGKAFGRRTVSIIGLRPVPPGTPGALSIEGCAANLVAAVALAACGAALGLIAVRAIALVAFAALAGATVESLLGATLARSGITAKHALNYMNSVVAALLAVYLI